MSHSSTRPPKQRLDTSSNLLLQKSPCRTQGCGLKKPQKNSHFRRSLPADPSQKLLRNLSPTAQRLYQAKLLRRKGSLTVARPSAHKRAMTSDRTSPIFEVSPLGTHIVSGNVFFSLLFPTLKLPRCAARRGVGIVGPATNVMDNHSGMDIALQTDSLSNAMDVD